jgi:hypothetical protein
MATATRALTGRPVGGKRLTGIVGYNFLSLGL